MSKYIMSEKTQKHTYMLWIAAFLLIFNVYHTKLQGLLLFTTSAVSTIAIQGFAFALLIGYFTIDKKLRIHKIEIQTIEWMLILSLLVIFVTLENYGENLTYVVRYTALVLIVVLMKYEERMSHIMFYCILAAVIIHVIASIWFYYDTDFYLQNVYPSFDTQQKAHLYMQVTVNNHAVGLASHYSQNGIYMAIALCCAFVLFFIKSKKSLCGKVALFSIVLVALVMTGKRGVLLFSVFAILVAYTITKKSAFANKLIAVLFAISALSIVIYTLSFYIEGIAVSLERVTAMFTADSETYDISNGRFKLYGIAWGFFEESPILGIGWREFSKEVVNFYNQDSVLRDAHNVFLQLLCETGVVGFTVFITMFITAFVQTVTLVLDSAKGTIAMSETTKATLVFSLCYQVFFLSYCITGNPLYDLETVYMYIISIGFTSSVCFNRKEGYKENTLKKSESSKYIK